MAGQDWFEKDFYATLGVPKNADAAAIKKAYRKLARTLHPDHNPGDDAAEARFKEVGEAYAVLSDPDQRHEYDAIRAMAGGGARFSAPGRGGGAGSPAGFEDLFGGLFGQGQGAGGTGQRVRYSQQGGAPGLEDLLGGLFGGGAAGGSPAGFRPNAGPRPGADLQAETSLPFRQAVEGSTASLTVEGRRVTARIPAGVRSGQKIRLRGKGRPGELGGPPGDLVIVVNVEPHPVFALDGRDLRIAVPVTFAEAALGSEVDVPTLDGGSVRVKVPEGTPTGRTFRVKGRGVTTPQGTGDLLVTVQVAVPQRLSEDARSAVKAFAEATADADVRSDLRSRATT